MGEIQRFEDLEVWQKSRELARSVYRVSAVGEFSQDFALRDQMRRAAVSVVSNIAEGFERDGNREFRQFLSLAKGSAGEVRAQLYVALDAGLISQQHFAQLYELAARTSRLLAGLMRYLDGSTVKGRKFRVTEEGIVYDESQPPLARNPKPET